MASPQGEQHAPGSSNNTSTFHNLDPRTREERLAAQSREKLEKNLLKARRGCFHKYEEAGNPIVPEPKNPMYSDEADRFKRDVAGEMRQQKVEAWKRQQETYNRKRGEQMEKEEQRWEKMAEAQALEAARMEAVRAAGIRGKQNQSSEHFNIITLNYHDTPQGHTLQYKDETTRYRAMLRSQNLFSKNHSVPHNIITGEVRSNPVPLPPAPMPPAQQQFSGTNTFGQLG